MFDRETVQEAVDHTVDLLNQKQMTGPELAYFCINIMRQIGISLYDREDTTQQSVYADMKKRRTLGGTLILLGYTAHEMVGKYLKDASSDHPANKKEVKEWETMLPGMIHRITGRNVGL